MAKLEEDRKMGSSDDSDAPLSWETVCGRRYVGDGMWETVRYVKIQHASSNSSAKATTMNGRMHGRSIP